MCLQSTEVASMGLPGSDLIIELDGEKNSGGSRCWFGLGWSLSPGAPCFQVSLCFWLCHSRLLSARLLFCSVTWGSFTFCAGEAELFCPSGAPTG